jgi:phenylacetate-CoA ligase
MGWECRETSLYHICDDNLIIEVLKEGGLPAREDEQGEVVVTSFHLRAMPFIRYRLEDLVTVGPSACPCGLPYSTLRTIEAKKQDYFRLPGGRELYPWAISMLLVDNAPWIMQFELLQERPDRVVMRAEARPRPSPEELAALTERIGPVVGPGVDFRIEIVPEIGARPGGKFWMRRSLVSSIYDEEPGPSS